MKKTVLVKIKLAVVWAILCIAAVSGAEESTSNLISLEGAWRLALDSRKNGITQQWFAADLATTGTIQLPGSLQMQGFGQEPSGKTTWMMQLAGKTSEDPRFRPYAGKDFKAPAWLTPKRHYIGPAWYQRKVSIPSDWAGQPVRLHLERAHWQTTVWVDDKPAGMQDSLSAPHEYDLSAILTPGEHRLTIRIDNSQIVAVGADAHGITDHTQTAWNGIIGAIRLERHNAAFRFEDVQVYPDVRNRSVKVLVDWAAGNPQPAAGILRAQAESFNASAVHRPAPLSIPVPQTDPRKGRLEFNYPLGEKALLWDEFLPALYRLTLTWNSEKGGTVERRVVFGLREAGTKGSQFTVNGRPIFLRGTHEGCIFPKTGYPPTDVPSWKRIFDACRQHGLNHVRFHSWCPPEAAFQAADETGTYLQVEAPAWANFGIGSNVDAWIGPEAQRIVRAYGNHPSFLLMSLGNEPHPNKDRFALLGRLTEQLTKEGPRQLFNAGTHRALIKENQFHVTGEPRIERFPAMMLSNPPQTEADYRTLAAKYTVPIISHESAQWCAYPNFAEIPKYDGFLRAGNYEIARDLLSKAGLLPMAKDFLMASGRFQTLFHKAEIEAALRTPGFGGFQLLSLQDYPGQGTSPVGILDAFWESKGYVTPEEYRRFCGPTVPLARMKKFVFTSDQHFEAAVELAHYGPAPLDVQPRWFLRDRDGRAVLSGQLSDMQAPSGGLTPLGTVTFPLAQFTQAQKLTFEVALQNTGIRNFWDIWVYPAEQKTAASNSKVHITRNFDEKTKAILNEGGSVLLAPKPAQLKCQTYGSFVPIFWNRLLFQAQKCHTLGILCNPAHPAFATFPTDSHSNWQWWELLTGDARTPERAKPIVLNDLGAPVEPLVRAIDDWFMCRNLGLLFEARVGKGKLMLCSMDILDDLPKRPVANQLRLSLLKYMESAAFAPGQTLTMESVQGLFRSANMLEEFQAKIIQVSSEEKGGEGTKAIDGYSSTKWQSQANVKLPQEIQIALKESVTITGFTYLPPEPGLNWIYDPPQGRIAGYAFYISDNPSEWGAPAAQGTFQNSEKLQQVNLAAPVQGRYVRLVATGSHDKGSQVAVAEIGLITSKAPQKKN